MQPKPMFFSFFHWYICVSFFISSQNATNRITNVYCFVGLLSFIIAFSSFVSTESTRRKIQRNRKTNWERDSSIIYLNLLNSPKSSAFWLSRKDEEKKNMKCWQRYVMVATNRIVSRKFIIIDDFWCVQCFFLPLLVSSGLKMHTTNTTLDLARAKQWYCSMSNQQKI